MRTNPPKPVALNDLLRQTTALHSELAAAMNRVLASGWYILGRECAAFESEFAAYCGVAHCVVLAGAEGFEPPLAVLETAGLPLNLRPCVAPPVQGGTPILLDFLMRLVLPAVPAELLHFQAFGGSLLVLRRRVVPVLALRALERNDVARHGSNSYLMISVTVPAPTVRPPSRIAKRKPLSMATGVINSTVNSTLSPGITISVPSGNCATPVTSVVRK